MEIILSQTIKLTPDEVRDIILDYLYVKHNVPKNSTDVAFNIQRDIESELRYPPHFLKEVIVTVTS